MTLVQADLVRDRYQLEQPLGHGGVAVVWRARDLRLNRAVAVKRLTSAALDDPTALERLQREALTIARLAHPNVVTVYDFGFDHESPYLVLELIEGPSLAAVLAGGPLPVERAVDIAAQTCRALAAAHAAGVVHRDVKPANLLLAPDGTVKVCDFGIAHLLNIPTLSPASDAGNAVGTSHYMAPETIAGDPVDPRTDLYAVGCLLYAMLVGHPPFPGENPVGVAVAHLNDPPPSLVHGRPDVPVALARLVDELLAKDPALRPPSADSVGQRLAAGAEGLRDSTLSPVAGLPRGDSPAHTIPLPRQTLPLPRHAADLRQGRRWKRPVVATALTVAAGIVVAAAIAANTGDDSPINTAPRAAPTAASPQPSRPAVGPSAVPGSPSPDAPRPPSTTPTLPRPADLVTGARAVVDRLVRDGEIDQDGGKEIDKRLTEAAEAMTAGEDDKAWEKLREAAEKLTNLRDEGKLTQGGYDALAGPLAQLARRIDRA